jgi:hypothetical protein
MPAESLHCPNCGAPLSFNTGQTLTICVYCNSSIRISQHEKDPPTVCRIPEISSEVVDEVKRLLVMSLATKAVSYYIKETGVSQTEAQAAVSSMGKTIGYRPPLNAKGLFILLCLASVSIAGLGGGLFLLYRDLPLPGAGAIAAAAVFAYMNWFAFQSSLKAYFIAARGIPADAVILKRWHVTSYPLKQGGQSFLLRLLVEVRPVDRPAYQAETNCLTGEERQEQFNVGSLIRVKCKRKNPGEIVVAGTA